MFCVGADMAGIQPDVFEKELADLQLGVKLTEAKSIRAEKQQALAVV